VAFGRTVGSGLAAITYLVLLAVAAMVALADPVAHAVRFAEFSETGAAHVAAALRAFGPGLLGYGAFLFVARAFYATIVIATLAGIALSLSPLDPIKALFWSAVINGVVAVPVMVMMMLITSNPKIMRKFVVTGVRRAIGWLATAVMAAAAIGMVVTSPL